MRASSSPSRSSSSSYQTPFLPEEATMSSIPEAQAHESPPIPTLDLPVHLHMEDKAQKVPYSSFYSRSRPVLTLIIFLFVVVVVSLGTRHTTPSVSSPGVKLSVSPLPTSSLEEDNIFCTAGRMYVYDLPPQFNADLLMECSSLVPWTDLCPALDNNGIGKALDLPSWMGMGFWYYTSQFGGEVMYHARMLEHPCRTLDPEKATAFFVPFYAGLDVARYLFVPSTTTQRDKLTHSLLDWLSSTDTWKRNGGKDHFFMIGRITWDFRRGESSLWDRLWRRSGWGSDFFLTPQMRNPLRLIIEKSIFDEQEIAVPYPTSFHPTSDSHLAQWQAIVRSSKRDLLFSYAGGPRPQFPNDFRSLLLEQCKNASSKCRSFDCSEQRCEHPLPAMELFLDSTFCLQPRGDSFTRRSIFDSLIAGCIPVFFWHRTAYLQYGWHLPTKTDSYSVYIDRKEVRAGKSIEKILNGFSERRILKMRETLITAIPRFVYKVPGNSSANFRDAFDIAIDGVLRLIQEKIRKPNLP
ncbi:hypothetical protein KP509_24G001500 [Ceratopteris richardii]|uniref:Exostosin GT47 domain-containing protein n=1 Tax=Ceratopteris richardii TaxID=49495 RepID=A0A8T2RUZ2_CERRI|nr:hypothetical protein KP509_24G001500 [Ceratopteris richardii]